MNNSIITISDIIDNRSCLKIFIENKNILSALFNIVSNSECSSITFNETLSLLILVLKFCILENYMIPSMVTNTIISININTLDDSNLTSANKSILHTDLSSLVTESLIKILKHFDLEKDFEYNDTTIQGSSCGISIKPLGTKRYRFKIILELKSLNMC